MQEQSLNPLQLPTWNWLHVNHASFQAGQRENAQHNVVLKNTEEVRLTEGTGRQPESVFAGETPSQALTLTVPAGKRVNEPVVLSFLLDEEHQSLLDDIHIIGEENSAATIVIQYQAEGKAPCLHRGYTYMEAKNGANIKLIKVQMLQQQDDHMDQVQVKVQDAARGDVVLCELGSKQTVASCEICLAGRESKTNLDGIYIGSQEKKLDLNYRIAYEGEQSEGDIVVRGALSGKAHKVMKSTIDFRKGAKGAKGREEETVLALSDQVVNLSAPLLLCGEDDVEGEHATSTGKPDAKKLYYLMSRGFSAQQAKKLLVKASFTPILHKIAPADLQQALTKRIEEVIHD